jgi:nucleotide-binding universal stress UspA family protein
MLRQILIPLDTKPYTSAATRLAALIARDVRHALGREAVTLFGLAIVDLDQLPSGRFTTLVPREEILADARQRAHKMMEDFRDLAAHEGISPEFVRTHFTEGSPFVAIMHHHVFSDMVVMGETCCFPPVSVDYDTMAHLYHGASRPILLTPEATQPVETVVMVVDGTAPSSRMLYAYAHLNPFPQARLLLAHSSYEAQYHALKDFFERVQAYLESFGFKVEQQTIEGHMVDELPRLVRERKAGAVAMGVHAEHFMDRLRNPLHLRPAGVQTVFSESGAALFTVH